MKHDHLLLPATTHRGFTLIEVIVCIVAAATLLAVAAPAASTAQARSLVMRDALQQREIHQSMLVWAAGNNGRLPTPGYINRLPDGGMNLPGFGAEDHTQNHSAALYSCMIAQGLINTDILISPIEVNLLVREKKEYDRSMYNPANATYWDPSFVMRIDDVTIGANASFAHLEIAGQRRTVAWRDRTDSNRPILSNRGPRDGATEGEQFTRSPTLRFIKPFNQWNGNVTFADNHVETLDTFVRADSPDNIFRDESAADAEPDPDRQAPDAWLGVFRSAHGKSCVAVWDPLTDAE